MSEFKKLMQSGKGLGTLSDRELLNEVNRRERCKPFPLHVFNEKIKPFIAALEKSYDLPPSYIGLSLLSAYSTAIGTAYRIETGKNDHIFLPIWGCLCGISNSGSTTTISKILEPLMRIQSEFDKEWQNKTEGLSDDKMDKLKVDTVIARDIHVPTLLRSVLPDNPKGILKLHDELLEWINSMNQLSKKEGTDEQFWLGSWNCVPYSGIRAGKRKFVIPHPFVNVLGKLQYALLARLFAKDRDTTGFAFRLLFALPEVDKIAQRESNFEMPSEWLELHSKSLCNLYTLLPVYDSTVDFKTCRLQPEAVSVHSEWRDKKIKAINQIADKTEMNCQSGIFGKISEYAYRFAAILHLADRAFDPTCRRESFRETEWISGETMMRSLELAEYFYESAREVYDMVQKDLVAPAEVLSTAYMLKRGKSAMDIGEMLYGARGSKYKVRAQRQIKKWIMEYPRIFGANTK